MSVYDRFTALGCYAVPRRRNSKIPLAQYWRKKDRVIASRDNVVSELENHNADGLCIVTGSMSGRLIVLDFDTAEMMQQGHDPVLVYHHFQHLSPNPFVVLTPAGGIHIYYRIPDNLNLPGNGKIADYAGIDVRGEGGQVVTVGGINEYIKNADKKGVLCGHRGVYRFDPIGEYNEIPYMTEDLYHHIFNIQVIDNPEKPKHEADRERIQAHTQQDTTQKVDITLECLSYILSQWDDTKDYDAWLQMWMASHHASDGATQVRDYIVEHPAIYWRDSEEGIQHFINAWDTHGQRENGYTVASLFWLARQAGWLQSTGYEIPANRVKTIDTKYITDWLETQDTIPRRMLLQSQTGSGKTYAIKYLYETLKKPRTVIFVPSVKLATELAHTLRDKHQLPAVLYRDNESAKTLDYFDMANAPILVTTLQTFATKVYTQGVPMSEYGLVYIEESDQLIQQFARGGGGYQSSHVREHEARRGFAVLKDAMLNSDRVICVDATMSRVTYDFAETLRGDNTISVIRNMYITEKAPVKFLDDLESVYSLVLAQLHAGRKVVYISDTRTEIDTLMLFLKALKNKSSRIAITRSTERNADVIEFMTDVNHYAGQYQLVAYNSVMASGVSITDIEPDIVIQVCRYLTPRINLQMLNRYRNQTEVYCLYQARENLYSPTQQSYFETMQRRTEYESDILNVPLAARNDIAVLRAYLASLSMADESAQRRSPVELYKALLEDDGRKIVYNSSVTVSGGVEVALERIREIKKLQKDEIARSWRKIKPIDSDRPAQPDMSYIDIARGETHAFIERSLAGNIPDDTPDEVIYETVSQFHTGRHLLMAAINPTAQLTRTIQQLADENKAYSTMYSNAALLSLMDTAMLMFPEMDDMVCDDVLQERAKRFMKEFVNKKDIYDTTINRTNQKYRAVFDRHETSIKRTLAFVKIILAQAGLKVRSKRLSRNNGIANYGYYIANIAEARNYVSWRSDGKLELDINTALMYAVQDRSVIDLYESLSVDRKQDILKQVAVQNMTYAQALEDKQPEW